MPRQATAAVTTLGIDIGKNVFHLIGLNKRPSGDLWSIANAPGRPTSIKSSLPCRFDRSAAAFRTFASTRCA
jgi:hypothetical protein